MIGDVKAKFTTLAFAMAFHPDSPAVSFDQVSGDGESDAAASGYAGAGAIGAVEAVKHMRQVLGRNADAGIPHADLNYPPLISVR